MDENSKRELIQQLQDMVSQRVEGKDAERIGAFCQQYYAGVSPEDLASRDAEDLYGAMLSHWRLGKRRHPGESLIHVYNPGLDEHGWKSRHTVLEVITDDCSFLVDSLSMECIRQSRALHLVVHPVINVTRLGNGDIDSIESRGSALDRGQREAWMHFEIDQSLQDSDNEGLQLALVDVLESVKHVVSDWPVMSEKMQLAIREAEATRVEIKDVDEGLFAESIDFLRWIDNGNFTYLGYRSFELECGEKDCLKRDAEPGLGIYRESAPQERWTLSDRRSALAKQRQLLILTKSTIVSRIHRPGALDLISIRRFSPEGVVIGEHRFHGLYSSTAYDARPGNIPLLRRKVAAVLSQSDLPSEGHGARALQHILHALPRDEIIQAPPEHLAHMALGILSVQRRRQLKAFIRADPFSRFVTALILVPRDHYNTEIRLKLQELLRQAFDGSHVDFNVRFTENVFAQVYFVIRTEHGQMPAYDEREIEQRLSYALLSWHDRFLTELQDHHGEASGNALFNRYANSLPPGYRHDFTARAAVSDICQFESLGGSKTIAMNLYRHPERDDTFGFKLFGVGTPMPLSDALPRLERMGLKVISGTPYPLEGADQSSLWLINFEIALANDAVHVDVLKVRDAFQDVFAEVCEGTLESDGFNALVLLAGLDARQLTLIRAISRYLRQTRLPFSQPYMESVLAAHADVAMKLANIFELRFHPERRDAVRAEAATDECRTLIDGVTSLDEDRILRSFLDTILAMVRTNYFCRDSDGKALSYLSFKLESALAPELPQPLPLYEIFVYATYVEGIHLRGGKVARGGLRWSDRREDFRTEVLGLMKAQMVKNALIVPVGAKGGFVPKLLPANGSRDEIQQEVIRCYRSFIKGLLDITDNLHAGTVIPPSNVVRLDQDDPYLVVAADKGTASFSDIANEISAEYDFWLGDAFASGGSQGYDHKKMGITARGAWESVKRHFRELGRDIQNEPFTLVGVGDMSGDVFGNGLLCSKQARLIAAFNHQHIFIDPDPDAGSSFAERQRLFALPRSGWNDYDLNLISEGGGVYPRSLKSIDLSAEACAVLDIEQKPIRPSDLISAILSAPVDLLWNGGIGTYVRASFESDADVGDRSNDALRIDAPALRCKVVGEGGNLGFTQRARIEYAQRGGLIYTDAIDNSGGVDCSDHEVNIKILLNKMVSDGDLTMKQRNQLLAEMTDEVGTQVLRNNYQQTQLISITADQSNYFLYDHRRLINILEKENRLNRKLEGLPSDEAIDGYGNNKAGLCRPEIAVLMAYAKIRLYDALLDAPLPQTAYLQQELRDYFPPTLQKRYPEALLAHSLHPQITATHLTNEVVNRMGSTFMLRMEEETGSTPADIVGAYLVAREVFDVKSLWQQIEQLDNILENLTQLALFVEIRRLLDRATRWLLRNEEGGADISTTIQRYKEATSRITATLPDALCGLAAEAHSGMHSELTSAGVPASLAAQVAKLGHLLSALDIARVPAGDMPIESLTRLYFALGDALELEWLTQQIRALPRDNHWRRSVRGALREEINDARWRITRSITGTADAEDSAEHMLNHWKEQKGDSLGRYLQLVAELNSAGHSDLAMLTVAVQALRQLA